MLVGVGGEFEFLMRWLRKTSTTRYLLYIYYGGQKSLRRNGVSLIVNQEV